MNSVSAAGGVLFRTSEDDELYVLLIYRRDEWDLPKGKKEEDESFEECALREVSEEVGCEQPEIYSKIATTYHEYERDNKKYGKTTHWYSMKSDYSKKLQPQKEEGIEKLAWVPLDEARKRVGYTNLIDVLDKFSNWYKRNNDFVK